MGMRHYTQDELDLVRDFLSDFADHVEKTEPYAVETIAALKAAEESIPSNIEDIGGENDG